MERLKEEAYKILDIIQKIYIIQESGNSNAIFKDKIFLIGIENDLQAITTERDYEKRIVLTTLKLQKLEKLLLKKKVELLC